MLSNSIIFLLNVIVETPRTLLVSLLIRADNFHHCVMLCLTIFIIVTINIWEWYYLIRRALWLNVSKVTFFLLDGITCLHCVIMHASLTCVCVCVCVREREREREERRDKHTVLLHILLCICVYERERKTERDM